ncbi:Crp/Fnr family transcriptional regulator [Aquimarina hainanensis]|uniref:Crp/Fnr family transcriptional regulator n=1 Tax=Aquimarina hainanensis TaxID=1578017 RepID=A0ABW5NCP6_9FLAO
MEKIISDIFKEHVTLTETEWKYVSTYFNRKEFPKNSYLLKEGQVAFEAFRIIKGCCRVYYNFDGKEKNIGFSREDGWETDVESFFYHTPSKMNIQAIENMTVYGLTYKKKMELFEYNRQFETYFRVLAEKRITFLNSLLIKRDTMNAKERFKSFKERQPWVFQRISQYHIASYLGITPTAYSLIQKELLQG